MRGRDPSLAGKAAPWARSRSCARADRDVGGAVQVVSGLVDGGACRGGSTRTAIDEADDDLDSTTDISVGTGTGERPGPRSGDAGYRRHTRAVRRLCAHERTDTRRSSTTELNNTRRSSTTELDDTRRGEANTSGARSASRSARIDRLPSTKNTHGFYGFYAGRPAFPRATTSARSRATRGFVPVRRLWVARRDRCSRGGEGQIGTLPHVPHRHLF